MTKPNQIFSSQTSQLFILRLWLDAENHENQHCIYGKIQHVPVGDCLYFQNWETLINFLEEQIGQRRGKGF